MYSNIDDFEIKSNDEKSPNENIHNINNINNTKKNQLKRKLNLDLNLDFNLDLKLQLLSLPEELHCQIITEYKKAKLFKHITSKNDSMLKNLEYEFINYNKPHPIEFYSNFIDLNDLNVFIRLLRIKAGDEFYTYIFKCIIDFLEHFNSLKYNEKQEIRDKILQGGIYDQYVLEYRERMSDLLSTKKYAKIIDPEDNHSGFSFGWCLSNLMPMVFGSHEQKVDHWIKLIRGHFYT